MNLFHPDEVRSLGSRTDLFLLAGQGAQITPREGYLKVEIPENPGYYWGNYLYFRAAPRPGDLAKWESLFHFEFRLRPEVRHVSLGWDSADRGETTPFEAAGFHYDAATVLCLSESELAPAPPAPPLEVRPLTDHEWELMIQHQIACRPEELPEEGYEAFKRRQASGYRKLVQAGYGHWYGAFLEGRLVADCGLFFGKDLGRFQNVGTHPDFRRRGICQAMVREVCRQGFAQQPGTTLVMAANAGEPPERLYRRVGFRPRELQQGLCRWPSPLTAP